MTPGSIPTYTPGVVLLVAGLVMVIRSFQKAFRYSCWGPTVGYPVLGMITIGLGQLWIGTVWLGPAGALNT